MMNDKLNVLIVEDEPLISIFIKNIVKEMGQNIVGICYNSHDALKVLESEKPDLIFMDINIQGPLDGISVLRKAQMTHNPTVFFVSAYSDKETISDALSTNPYSYIIKPIKEEDIEIAITLAKKDQKKIVIQPKEHILFSDDIYYDLIAEELFENNKALVLSKLESRLLNLFMTRINTTLTIEEIKSLVWEEKKVSDTTVRDTVSNLRKKTPELNIETNFGKGYVLSK